MVSKDKQTIILMPPKTASNSVRVLLEQSGWTFCKEPIPSQPTIHLKLSELIESYGIDNPSDYKIIQITRNPYTRFVSSFYFQKKILPNNYNPIFKDYSISEFTHHLKESKKSSDFIKAFYGDVSFVINNIKNGINWGGSRLYDTQVSWNDLNQNVIYFKLEELINDITPLKQLLNLGSSNLPNINSQEIGIDYTSLLTPDVIQSIMDMFHADFKTLGYSF